MSASQLIPTVALALVLSTAHGAGNEAELQAIAEMVQASQRAGFVKHDFEKYIAPWADGSKMVLARGEKPGKHDNVMPVEKLRPVRKLRMSVPRGSGFLLNYFDEKFVREGDSVTLRWTARSSFRGGHEATSELYVLQKLDGAWKIVENRAWITNAKYGDRRQQFDEAGWGKLDAAVEVARKAGDAFELAQALFEAYRFKEAHTAAVIASKKAAADDPEPWLIRGHSAILIGDADDGLGAFKKALKADPDAPVPDYVNPDSR